MFQIKRTNPILLAPIMVVCLAYGVFCRAMVVGPGTDRVDIKMSAKDREALKAPTKTKVSGAQAQILTEGKLQSSTVVKVSTRGQTSLKQFPRKNLSLKSDSKENELLSIAGIESRELILTAGVQDALLVKNMLVYRLFGASKIPTLQTSLAEVVLNEKSQGLYMVTDSPANYVLNSTPEADVVLRRRYNDDVEVKEVRDGVSKQQTSAYVKSMQDLHLVLTQLEGDKLLAALTERMDLDQYMRWTAVNFLVQNGDYSDEVFFVGTKKADQIYFTIFPWDLDDTFATAPHLSSIPGSLNHNQEARRNRQLIYSFESRLDVAISENSVLLEKYFQILDQVTQDLSDEQVDRIFSSVETKLRPYLNDVDILSNGRLDSGKHSHRPSAVFAEMSAKNAFLKERLRKTRTAIVEIKSRPRDRSMKFSAIAKKLGFLIMNRAALHTK